MAVGWLSWVVLAQSISWGHSQDVGLGWSHLKALLGLHKPLTRWLTQSCGQESVSCHMDLSMGLLDCPPNLAAGFPHGVCDLRESEVEVTMCFKDLALKVTHYHFCTFLLVA